MMLSAKHIPRGTHVFTKVLVLSVSRAFQILVGKAAPSGRYRPPIGVPRNTNFRLRRKQREISGCTLLLAPARLAPSKLTRKPAGSFLTWLPSMESPSAAGQRPAHSSILEAVFSCAFPLILKRSEARDNSCQSRGDSRASSRRNYPGEIDEKLLPRQADVFSYKYRVNSRVCHLCLGCNDLSSTRQNFNLQKLKCGFQLCPTLCPAPLSSPTTTSPTRSRRCPILQRPDPLLFIAPLCPAPLNPAELSPAPLLSSPLYPAPLCPAPLCPDPLCPAPLCPDPLCR